MTMTPITYTSNQPADWANAITHATTLDDLRRVVEEWKELVADAHARVATMTEQDFDEWRHGLLKERRGQFAGEAFAARYGDVLMPTVLLAVSFYANQLHVPWGLMYLRLKETGQLQKVIAPATSHEPPATGVQP